MNETMNGTAKRWTLLRAFGTARPPDLQFVAIASFGLAIVIGVISGLEDSTSGLSTWSRLWRWCAANLVAAATVTAALAAAKFLTDERWYLTSARARALALIYGVYASAGLLGGFARFVMTKAIDVPPAEASPAHHAARVAAIASGVLFLGFVANQLRWFVDHTRAQQQALRDRIDELDREVQVRRMAERNAAIKEERLAAVLRTMDEGVILADRVGRVVLVNPAAQKIIGRSQSEAAGKPLAGVFPKLAGRQPEAILVTRPSGLPHEIETEDQPHRYLEAAAAPISDGPEAGGRVLLLRDVTDEKAVRQRSEQEQRLASLGQLAAGFAHDFNNVLTAIAGASNALEMRGDLPGPAHTLVEQINQAGLRATHLVRQVLDFSRQRSTSMVPLDMSAVATNIQDMLRHVIPDGVQMRLDIEDAQLGVVGDSGQLERVITNLAVNAGQAMPEGGELRIRLSRRELEPGKPPPVPDMAPGAWVAITVSDTGLGIPSENLDKVFDPFFTTKDRTGGTGLGLAQVYGIVKQHAGFIAVDSRLGVGTTFTVFLPAVDRPATPPAQAVPGGIPHGNGETVLLVEDDPLVLEVMETTLEVLGYAALTATNGQQALKVYEDHRPEIGLVLTDVTMPVMSGIELFRILRDRYPDVKLIALTGHAFDQDTQRYLASGMIEWLEKPPDLPALAHALRRALAGQPRKPVKESQPGH